MIVGLSGKIGSGKSTVSEIFRENNFKLDSFANSVKDVSNSIFGFDRSRLEGITKEDRIWRETPDERYTSLLGKSFSPRDSLILIGTTLGRNQIHPDIWVESVFNRYDSKKNLLITDVRFPNEYNSIKKRGGVLIRINRQSSYRIEHESECALDKYNFDYVIENDGTLDELKKKTNDIIESLY
jgi:hypothetical protein